MVNRRFAVIKAFTAVVAASAVVAVFISHCPTQPPVSEKRREAGERFFGSSNELPPIPKGQEMRPRW